LITVVAVGFGWWAERLKRTEAESHWHTFHRRSTSVEWQLQQHGFVFETVFPDTSDEDVKIRLTRPEMLHRPDGFLTIEPPPTETDLHQP
jgi:hypothetical protein